MDDVTVFRRELGARIGEMVARFATKSAAAETAGVTAEQMNKWIRGEVKVPVDALWLLATAVGVDFCWLCTGRAEVTTLRPAGRPIQETTLRDVLSSLAEVIATDGVVFAPHQFGDLVLALHDYVARRRAEAPDDADLAEITNLIRLSARSPQRPQP